MNNKPNFPFSAIAGQDNFKLCLILNLIDPSIGGVLALGDKGTGKTTTVRALHPLMQPIAPDFNFVNLPIGASEDRVLGTVDLEKLINEKKQVLQKGLLAQAHQGVLYIDEVNLLGDYLIDILLDAATTGGYHLEREGFSLWQQSRFALVGTMNPEEGELRPQLLDRFGLSVRIATPQALETRKVIIRRRIAFDQNPEAFVAAFAEQERATHQRIGKARQKLANMVLPEEIYDLAARKCLTHKVEGMRADILLIKTALAYAAWQGEETVTPVHLDTIAPFVLGHRSKNPQPPEDNNNNNNNNGGNKDNLPENTPETSNESPATTLGAATRVFDKTNDARSIKIAAKKAPAIARKGLRLPKAEQATPGHSQSTNKQAGIDISKTVKNYSIKDNFELIRQRRQAKTRLCVYFLIDSSGSMARKKQISHAKGLISQTLETHKGKRIRFAAVSLTQGSANICHPLTDTPPALLESLEKLPTGGKTNLEAGFEQIHQLMPKNQASRQMHQQLYIFTDGRINCSNQPDKNPLTQAVHYHATFLKSLTYTQVIDTESSFIKLGKAKVLAEQLGGRYETLEP